MKRFRFGLIALVSLVPASGQAQKAYITNGSDNTVSVIDTTTNTAIGSPITVGPFPLGVAFTPDGSTVYVTNHHSNTESTIDTETDTKSGNPTRWASPRPVGRGPPPAART